MIGLILITNIFAIEKLIISEINFNGNSYFTDHDLQSVIKLQSPKLFMRSDFTLKKLKRDREAGSQKDSYWAPKTCPDMKNMVIVGDFIINIDTIITINLTHQPDTAATISIDFASAFPHYFIKVKSVFYCFVPIFTGLTGGT